MEPKPKERIVFDEDLYYGDEGEEMAINDLMERDGLTEGEVREDFTDDEIFNHQMPDNDFWIGQEQIPVDLSLLLTYHNDEDYWYAPGEYALRVYTVDTLNTNFARPCFALGERKFDPEMEDVSGAIENTLHELLDSGATPEDVYRIMGLVKESELSPETKEADSYLPIDLGYCIDGNIVSYEAVPESVATVPENVDYPRYAEAMESHVPLPIATQISYLS